jgi:hypothetical protein
MVQIYPVKALAEENFMDLLLSGDHQVIILLCWERTSCGNL